MKRPRILVDCDGILSDFVKPTLDLVFEHTGDRHTHEEIVQWDVFAAIGKKQHEHILNDAVLKGGFALDMPLLPGSLEAMKELKSLGDVFIVTSPFDAPNWVYERTTWLKRHFDIDKKQVVNAASKFVVVGDVLIDDSERNLKEWLEYHPNGMPVLFDRPWNRHVDHPGVHRVTNWDTLVSEVKEHLAQKA